MKRDHQHLTRFVFQLERELVPLLKMDFGEGDADDLFDGMIQVSDLKIGCSEFSVPADFVYEPLYRNHRWAIGLLSPPRWSMKTVSEIGRLAQLLEVVKSILASSWTGWGKKRSVPEFFALGLAVLILGVRFDLLFCRNHQ
jgi:hypothetical protein